MKYIDQVKISNKKVLVRVDYNVSLNENHEITNDTRIIKTLPTLNLLLRKNNQIILISHLGRPEKKDPNLSLKPAAKRLQELLPKYKITLVCDFLSNPPVILNSVKDLDSSATPQNDNSKEVFILENIRFYPEEEKNDSEFARKLASLANIYVNDAFSVSHRNDASIVGISKFIPHYGGLLLKKEIEALTKIIANPRKPFVAIIGGAKVKTKLPLLLKFTKLVNYLLLGGKIANSFLGIDENYKQEVEEILSSAQKHKTKIILPQRRDAIFDIDKQTQQQFTSIISQAKTIIWNGPLGLVENPKFTQGTASIYEAIVKNNKAYSVIGGGDTLAAIDHKKGINKISFISTGGGAMLEFIAKETLPGIEALR